MKKALFFISLLILFSACNTGFQEGTVRYIDLEGGFYGIEEAHGARLLPLNLPKEFQKEGLKIRFKSQPKAKTMTLQMWGEPIEVVEIHTA